MDILIINSSLPESPLTKKVKELEMAMIKENHQVNIFHLQEMKIRFCRGCFICWWTTPGLCEIPDDMPILYQHIMDSSLVIFAAEIKMGFIDSSIKKVQDRMIALLHPYFEIVNQEFHHQKRYPQYPQIALLLQPEESTTEEDLKIVNQWFHRFALNFKTKVKFILTTNDTITPENYEINQFSI